MAVVLSSEDVFGAVGGVAITPSDSATIEPVPRALWVGVSGDINVEFIDGSTAILKSAAAGTPLPLQVSKVLATSTTATDIVALY
ncbi:MAG: hypothetical protein ABJ360_22495 [Roseobacter sp.]